MTTLTQSAPAIAPGRWYAETIGVLDMANDSLLLHRFAMEPVALTAIPENVGDLALLAAEYELGQIWITPRCAREVLQLPDKLDMLSDGPAPHDFGAFDLTDATVEPAPGVMARWYVVRWTDGSGRISIVLPHLDQDAPWKNAQSANDLIRALRLFRDAVQSEWHWSVGSTASGLASKSYPNLRREWSGKAPAVQCRAVSEGTLKLAQPAETGAYRSPLSTMHSRPWDGEEEWHEFVYSYDCNAAYLGSLGAAIVGRGEPVHWAEREDVITRLCTDAIMKRLTAGTLPGYFRLAEPIRWPVGLVGRLPLFRFGDPDSLWITHPILEFVCKQGISFPSIVEAYVWHDTVRPFEEWQSVVSKARGNLISLINATEVEPGLWDATPEGIALDAVKSLYAVFYTWLGRRERASDRGLWRPDWSHTISDLAVINHWRRVLKIHKLSGRWPVAMRNDELLYTSDEPTHAEAAPAGLLMPAHRPLGTFKPNGWASAVTIREYRGETGKFWAAWERKMMKGEHA